MAVAYAQMRSRSTSLTRVAAKCKRVVSRFSFKICSRNSIPRSFIRYFLDLSRKLDGKRVVNCSLTTQTPAFNFLEPYLNSLLSFLGLPEIQFFNLQATTGDEATVAKNTNETKKAIADAISAI